MISVGDELRADAEVPSGQEQGSDDRRLSRLAWIALAIALLPIVVAAVRAVQDGWVPVGDAAVMAVRTRDVFGGELPHLGMWASTSRELGIDFNHPGPMLYLLMAVPAAIFGGPGGIVAGTALVHVSSVVGMFAVARRRGGPLLAIATMAVVAAFCWSMGSAVLVEPWHATTVLLPFLLFVMLSWSVACGDLVCLPFAVVVGSLVLQTNLSFTVFVPALLVLATVTGVVRGRPSRRAWWLAGLTLAVGIACWALPLAEQMTGPSDDGNLSRLLESRELEQTTLDAAESFRTAAAVLALPPWWVRPSWSDTIEFSPFANPLPSLGVAIAGLAALAALLAISGRLAWRRGDRDSVTAVIGAAVLGALAVVTAGQTPTSVFGTVGYQLRWLWPVGAFIVFAVVAAWLGGRAGSSAARWAAPLVLITALFALANLPASDQGTTAPAPTQPVARLIADAVAEADVQSTLLVTCAEHIFDPYCETTLDALQRRDVDFVVPWNIDVRQLGTERRWSGTNAAAELEVVTGDYAAFTPPDSDVLFRHEALSAAKQEELVSLRAELVDAIADGTLTLNERGRRVADEGLLGAYRDGAASPVDAEQLVRVRTWLFGADRRDLVAMANHDLLDAPGDWERKLRRYSDLQVAWDEGTVALWLHPLPRGS